MEVNTKKQPTHDGLETEITSNGSPKVNDDDVVKLPVRQRRSKDPGPVQLQTLGKCVKCGYMSSQAMCQACTLLENLNKNRPEISIEG